MEILGVPYGYICVSVLLTAALYYLGLFIMVDLEAQKYDLKGIPRSECPKFKDVFKEGFHFVIPVVILITLLMYVNVSETRAAFVAVISIPLVSWLRKSTRMSMKQILRALEKGAINFLPITGIVVACNILVGMITLTGLGLQLSSILIELAGDSLFVLLLLTMIASLILGLGLPIMVSYLVLAVLVAPALVQMGVLPIAAHLFIFIFAVVSDLTPPVAPGAFIAAGIAGADMMRSAWQACRLGLVVYILPFMFVYDKSLLLKGSIIDIITAVFTTIIGVYALSFALQGFIFRRINVFQRILCLSCALALISPWWVGDLIGIAVVGIMAFTQRPTLLADIFRYFKKETVS
jgi:TRAP transporter 4TM/12TM fusion protein